MKQIRNKVLDYIIESAPRFLEYKAPNREFLLSPWLTTQSLNMIYAWRGIGKTHMALAIAHSIATSTEFLGWKPMKECKVLYIDGEMPMNAMQERLSNYTVPVNNNLIIFSADIQNHFMPDLTTKEGQEIVDDIISDDTLLIIIDNLSCLTSGRENDAESWYNISKWAIRKRSEGKSIIFIHHSGKDGNQRGTSKREDILDTVIALKSPGNYCPTQGARFEVHFEKARHLYGQAISPFMAELVHKNNTQEWNVSPINNSVANQIMELRKKGLAVNEIATKLDMNRSTVYRYLKNK